MWIVPTADDLAQTLSQLEINAFHTSGANDGSDPAERLVFSTAEFVRSHLRTNGCVALSPERGAIPESLLNTAMDYAAYQVLKRKPVPVEQDRRDAYKAACELFDRIASRKLTPESYGAGEAENTGTIAVEVVNKSRQRVTAAKLEGL